MANRNAAPPRSKSYPSVESLREATVRQCLAEWRALHPRQGEPGPALTAPLAARCADEGPWTLRHALVERLDGGDCLAFGRACSPRELALCSLLAGNFPRVNLPRASVRRVIDDEERRIRKIRRELALRSQAAPAPSSTLAPESTC